MGPGEYNFAVLHLSDLNALGNTRVLCFDEIEIEIGNDSTFMLSDIRAFGNARILCLDDTKVKEVH